jgi:hypothetical protein
MVTRGGEAVRIVDNPSLASERVTLFLDERPLDRSAALRLTKAALKDQKRQERGKKDKGVFEQIVEDVSRPAVASGKAHREGGFNWMGWAIAGSVGWLAVVIAAGVPLAILVTPIFGPLFGWMFAGFLRIVFA